MTRHIPALIYTECKWEACRHGGDCPTQGVLACGTCPPEESLGEIVFSQPWPCPHSPGHSGGARHG